MDSEFEIGDMLAEHGSVLLAANAGGRYVPTGALAAWSNPRSTALKRRE
jgi:hypothetical protein